MKQPINPTARHQINRDASILYRSKELKQYRYRYSVKLLDITFKIYFKSPTSFLTIIYYSLVILIIFMMTCT